MSRGHETGMDFEWQNRTGQIDVRSPFAQVSQNAQRFGTSTPSKQRRYMQQFWGDNLCVDDVADGDV